MTQRKFCAVFMRGGTSKAIMFHARDLPAARDEWDGIFLAAMGSPDPTAGNSTAWAATPFIGFVSPAQDAPALSGETLPASAADRRLRVRVIAGELRLRRSAQALGWIEPLEAVQPCSCP